MRPPSRRSAVTLSRSTSSGTPATSRSSVMAPIIALFTDRVRWSAMMPLRRRILVAGALAALLPGRAPGAPLAGDQLAEHAWQDEVVKTARAYQATLDELAA